ncbi:hypothetical protein PIB30_019312 [Stylosanthes scabra]|uniref:Uncharacterized protein n=1 Tax=Stylosanthes scabra TaxID=79078 RepID=A0ABU6V6D9_9FABA|nr:hypothetical protein [Stylosanthes scabra]
MVNTTGTRHPPSSSCFPLHRISVALRHLRHSTWLTHLHQHHPNPQCRRHVNRLFCLIDQLQQYMRQNGLLPPNPAHPSSHRPPRRQSLEERRMHQHQLRESLARIRQCLRPLQQYLRFHQPNHVTPYHQSLTIISVFTTRL